MDSTNSTDGTQPQPAPRTDLMSAHLSRNWWLVALRGVAGIVFGVAAFSAPVAVMLSLALFFAIYLLVDGVFTISSAIRAASRHERWGWLMAEGVLSMIMGVIAAAFPGAAVVSFVIVTAVWALMSGGMMLIAAFRLHQTHGRWWMVLGGAVSMIWGALLVIAPLLGALVLTWWLGAYAFVFGVTLLVLAFRLRARRDSAPPLSQAQAGAPG